MRRFHFYLVGLSTALLSLMILAHTLSARHRADKIEFVPVEEEPNNINHIWEGNGPEDVPVEEDPNKHDDNGDAGGPEDLPEEGVPEDEDTNTNKYFWEAGGPQDGPLLGHYDHRYFHGLVSSRDRKDAQLHMIRAYLEIFSKMGLETWLAHGTLLGWWWNQKMLPWDWDLDTQVTLATLNHLAQQFNQTTHKYSSTNGTIEREYFLDINPWYWQRDRGDGANVIDARWIDVRNGLFVDITGLSEVHPVEEPGVWSCKNFHRYRMSELYPLRESIFEDFPAKIPFAYGEILAVEYERDALYRTEWEGHRWNPNNKEWEIVPSEEKKTIEEKEGTA